MDALITTDLIVLDDDLGQTSEEVIGALAERLEAAGRADDAEGLTADVLEREGKAATGLPGGIAIPHCRSAHMTTGSLAFARLDPKADFGADDDEDADLVFLIAAAADGDADHMKLLTKLARALVKDEFRASLRSADSAEEVVRIVSDVVEPEAETASASTETDAASATAADGSDESEAASGGGTATATDDGKGTERPLLVGITACPTGIAHTYMAADSLEAAAEEAGADIVIETQGSSGSTPLSKDQIERAVAVIFAADVGIKDRARFAGKPVVQSGVKRAINEPGVMVSEALHRADDPNAPRVEGDASDTAQDDDGDAGAATKLRQWLMTGVSYMIPFVAAGGLLIALGFLLGGYDLGRPDDGLGAAADALTIENSLLDLPEGGLLQYLGAVAFKLGSLGFGFLVPALAGYIAYAIADRPGIAPGFIVGQVAVFVGGGFVGGLIGGLMAGGVALWISRRPVPEWARGLMPVVVIPLGATLVAGGVMFLVLGEPLAAATSGLESWLNSLSGSNLLVLGAVVGLMMAFDMGGPVNKAAYTFAAAGLGAGATATGGDTTPLTIMAAVMAAGMTPPLGLALATVLRPGEFTPVERENGKAAWLLGASFITEGAIPFAAADPVRVIPPIMLGSAVTGAIVAAGEVTLRAPHGGIFVLFAMSGILTFVIALAVGTAVTAAAVIFAKSVTTSSATATATG